MPFHSYHSSATARMSYSVIHLALMPPRRMHAAIAPGLLAVADGLHAREEWSIASRLHSAGRPYDGENNDQRSSPDFGLNKQHQDVVRPIHVGFISKLFGEMVRNNRTFLCFRGLL